MKSSNCCWSWTNINGKVSRQEFKEYMVAEFDRLDKDKSGELDVKKLAQSQFQVFLPLPVSRRSRFLHIFAQKGFEPRVP